MTSPPLPCGEELDALPIENESKNSVRTATTSAPIKKVRPRLFEICLLVTSLTWF